MIPKTPQARRVAFLFFAAVGLLFSVLVLAFWGFVRDTIVIPLYYMIWLGGLAIRWPPQWVYLSLLAILCFFLGIDTLRKARVKKSRGALVSETNRAASRYQTWARYCLNLQSGYTRENFSFTTVKFLLDLLAEQENLETKEIEARIENGQIEAPEMVRRLIRERQLPPKIIGSTSARRGVNRVFDNFREQFGWKNAQKQAEYAAAVEEILQFIEKRLEIESNGNGSRS